MLGSYCKAWVHLPRPSEFCDTALATSKDRSSKWHYLTSYRVRKRFNFQVEDAAPRCRNTMISLRSIRNTRTRLLSQPCLWDVRTFPSFACNATLQALLVSCAGHRLEVFTWLQSCSISPILLQRSHGQHERCQQGVVPLRNPVECYDISSASSSVSNLYLSSNTNPNFDCHSSGSLVARNAGGAFALSGKAQSHSLENLYFPPPYLVFQVEWHASCNGCCMLQGSVQFLCWIKSAGVNQLVQDSKGSPGF